MKKVSITVMTMLIMIIFSGVIYAADRVSLGFIYGSSDCVELVDRTNGSINQVSPTCLDLDAKGNLVITAGLTHEFVDAMHERDIIVTPFLSNHWVRSKGRAAIKNADKLSDQIVASVEEYNLDGINVDIENLKPEDKDAFSNFVKVLREKLPEEKILTVSVAANPDGKETGWQGSYDYAELEKYSDYLFVMAYDEHSQGGMCGPVASIDFVENSIKYALQYVSKDKIVLGIPLYGRYWKDGEEYGGEAVVIGAVPTLISKNKGIVKYDEEIGEACVTFSIENPAVKSKINGVTLEDGSYTIWYQNEESIKAKLNLINEYDLLGAGVWALGQEKVDVWEYYKNELNRIPYESLEEESVRESYEALVVDMSRLEIPAIHPLEYKTNEIDSFESIRSAKTKEAKNKQEMFNKNNSKKIEDNKIMLKRDVIDEQRRKKENSRLITEKNNMKTIHIYRWCKV